MGEHGSDPFSHTPFSLLLNPYSVLVAHDLQKRFASVHAVRSVSLQAHPGEIFGLIGPNGAGKSTTIRMLVNIIHPDSGTITYDGQPFDESVRNSIGYLAEERGLYQKSRIGETIIYFASLRGLGRNEAQQRAVRWLERFGLHGQEGRKIEELSKGNQQKVQLIITLIHEPRWLILDEPASGLDPVNQELLREILEELRADGRTILYSTHQMELAERLCTRIALINRGEVVLAGTVDAVREAHGGTTVRLEFEGDGQFLSTIPPVRSAHIDAHRADLELHEGRTLNDILPHLGTLQLSSIARVRPSLNSIFISTVGGVAEKSRGGA